MIGIEIDRTISYGTYFQIILKLVLLNLSSLNKKKFDFIEFLFDLIVAQWSQLLMGRLKFCCWS